MIILAVTCYTGDEDLAKMTGECIDGLRFCRPSNVDLSISVVGQGTVHSPPTDGIRLTFYPHNVGFAFGMNLAIRNRTVKDPDFVLCLNNDLEFPDKRWLRHLVDIAANAPDQVIVPATDKAAIRKQDGPKEAPSVPVQESSAYCWLIPWKWCKWLKKEHGFWLFSEDFAPAYGEDNWTAFLLAKEFGENPFRYVPRSFVRHLRGRTASTVKHDRKKTNKVLIEKLQGELQDPGLRADLRGWAKRYIEILSRRT